MHGIEELPDGARQARLRAGLAKLIAQRGFAHFVTAPILEPTNRWFPDAWARTRGGVKRLIRRLLWYAGLPELGVELEVFDGHPPDEPGHIGIAAWFGGIRDGRASFGLDLRQLEDLEAMVGVLCHEVAHAFRTHHAIVVTDPEIEEALTDLTTVYLGFGILSTNATFRYRTRTTPSSPHYGVPYDVKLEVKTAGYLTAAEMSFLLAIQTLAREASPADVKRVRGSLSATQAALFDEARRALADDLSLPFELGIPAKDGWPDPALEAPTPFVDEPGDASDDERIVAAHGPSNERRHVFRVARSQTGLGVVVALVVTIPLSLAFLPTTGTRLLAAVGGVVLGLLFGSLRKYDVCSDPACEAVLPEGIERCPRCRGRIGGRIADPNDRLVAEESLDEPEDDAG